MLVAAIDIGFERTHNRAVRMHALGFVLAIALLGQSLSTDQWVSGEIGYRVTVIPEGSAGARIGLRVGDILAEPGPLPVRLRESPAEGVEIPLYRVEDGKYVRTKIRVAFAPARRSG